MKIQEKCLSESDFIDTGHAIVSETTTATVPSMIQQAPPSSSPSSSSSSSVKNNNNANPCANSTAVDARSEVPTSVVASSTANANLAANATVNVASNNSSVSPMAIPLTGNTFVLANSSKYVTAASSAGISFNAVSQSVTSPPRSTAPHYNITSPPVGFNQYYYPFGTYHAAGATIAAAAAAASSSIGSNLPFSHVHHGPPSHPINPPSVASATTGDLGSGFRSPDLPTADGELDYVPHFQRVYITGAENALSGVS